jgi:hypothetical protein
MASPASADSVAAVGYKLGDTRSDLLVGQGQILKNAGDNTSAILRDANNNTQFTNANIERNSLANMQETARTGERLGAQANTVAWNEMNLQDAGFAAQRVQNQNINDAQSAFSDRANKFNAQMITDSFGRLSAQGENGFARELDATTQGSRQTVQSEMGVTRNLYEGFRDGSASAAGNYANLAASAAANYANLTAQNFGTKEAVAMYGNRMSDQTASVLATLTGQHTSQTRDLVGMARELATQAANNAAAAQLEGSKNSAASQLQNALNAKDAAIQAAVNAKEAALQAAVNSKESMLQSSFLAKDALLENSKWFALAEKTAMVNKLDTDAKLAVGFSDIKEAVIGTSNSTQALIQATDGNRVRDALNIAATENSILRLRREDRPIPVPYPVPYHQDHHHHHRRRSESPRRDDRR